MNRVGVRCGVSDASARPDDERQALNRRRLYGAMRASVAVLIIYPLRFVAVGGIIDRRKKKSLYNVFPHTIKALR